MAGERKTGVADYYTLKDLRVSDYKDDYANTWCDVVFLEVGEPVKWVMKDPAKAVLGETYYGRIEDKTSRAGKTYLRFYKEEVPDDSPAPDQSKPSAAKQEYRRDTSTLALDVYRVVANIRGLPDNADDASKFWEIVMSHTDELLRIIDNVRGIVPSKLPALSPTNPTSGYDKFKATTQQIFNDGETSPGDEDFQP